MAESLKPIHSYYDESLSSSAVERYIMSIQTSLDGFSFCILDTILTKFVALEHYNLQDIESSIELCQEIEKIILTHDILPNQFKKVIFLSETEKTTLIPDKLFSQAEMQLYLRFNHPFNEYEHACYDSIHEEKCKNVFALPDCLRYRLETIYPNVVFHHHSSVFIESTLSSYKDQLIDKQVFVNVRDNVFDLMITDAEKLIFYNAFKFKNVEDYIYFLMNAIEQTGINPLENKVTLFGNIDKVSPLYKIMTSYIKRISFGERTALYSYSLVLAQVPFHSYYTLFNSHICEL